MASILGLKSSFQAVSSVSWRVRPRELPYRAEVDPKKVTFGDCVADLGSVGSSAQAVLTSLETTVLSSSAGQLFHG
jgi:hypothetical protein